MTLDPALVDALEEPAPTSWSGEAHRLTSGGRSPDRENTFGARWNPAGVPNIYTALSRDAPDAAFLHVQSGWVPPPNPSKFRAYRLQISVSGVLDLRDEGVLLRAGLTEDDLGSDSFDACQRVGGAAHWLGRAGLLVPSVRHPIGSNLVIFTDNVDAEFLLEEVGSAPMR